MVISLTILLFVFFVLACICAVKLFPNGYFPLVILIIWHAVKLPYYFIFSFYESPLFSDVDFSVGEVSYLFFIKFSIVISAFFGFFLVYGEQKRDSRVVGLSFSYAVFFVSIGVVFIFVYFYSIGGVGAVFESFTDRGNLTRGSIIFLSLAWVFLGFGVVASVGTSVLSTQLALLLIVSVAMFFSYGSRSLSVGVVVVWYVSSVVINSRPPIKILSVPVFFASAFLLFVFVSAPLFRVPGALDIYSQDYSRFLFDVVDNWFELFSRLAVPDIEFLVLRFFEKENLWFGRSFLDLAYFFCPTVYCPAKPPIDDGVYLYNILLNGNVVLGTPVSDMEISSLPFETWSIFYANFGLPGVFFGGLIQGVVAALIFDLNSSKYIQYRLVGAYSVGLMGVGFFHLSNLYFGLFFFPVLLLLILAKIHIFYKNKISKQYVF